MKLSEELMWRGFINQTTIKDLSDLDKESVSFYFGVDPSADSMTIGNLAAAMMVRCFIDHGHKPYLLVGGATGMIGDPDGRADERNIKTLEEIARNKAGISAQYKQLFAGQDIIVVDNYDWFKDINYIDFLREVGKNVPMSQMLGREFIQSRLGKDGAGISYAEFSYCLIQAYDFLHLYRQYGVNLQLCGADQWGNSIAGVDLIRRVEGAETNVYSTPLIINKSTGKKFGKSEDGAVWLDAKKTSVYKFYQFWLNVDDDSVIDHLKTFTLLAKDDIEKLAAEQSANPSARQAQKALASAVTEIVHGKERTDSVKRVTEVLFGDLKIDSLSADELALLAAEIPSFKRGDKLLDYLVKSELASSLSDARRLISSGAIGINDQKQLEDTVVDKTSLIKKGKNSFILIN